jgi:hypothetical protein
MGIFHCDGQFRVLGAVWAPSFGETHLLEARRILRQQTSQVTHHVVIANLRFSSTSACMQGSRILLCSHLGSKETC